jgi:maltooligosyltrehalose synthase
VSPETRYTNVFTGELVTVPEQQNLPLSTLLASYPVGLFISEE